MSTQQLLHKVADNDTPQAVSVPATWPGLITWAIARFGVQAVWLAAAAMGLVRVYEDMGKSQERVMQIIEKRAETDVGIMRALADLRQVIEEMRRDARDAHRP